MDDPPVQKYKADGKSGTNPALNRENGTGKSKNS